MNIAAIRQKFRWLAPTLNERTRRLFAAAEAKSLGRGGMDVVIRATGVSRSTVARGIRELGNRSKLDPSRIRRSGAGRKCATAIDSKLIPDLERLVEPGTRGDPRAPLRWTCRSVRNLAEELRKKKHEVSHGTVATLLQAAGYSLQSNRKTREGSRHPDRNAQFEYIARRVYQQQTAGEPAISVDTKKKELVGDFKNGGREWRPAGMPESVRVHDFIDRGKGKAIPYGIYDLVRNQGWVSVGIDHDTASFAVNAIRRWWRDLGRHGYSKTKSLLITADAGGSNGPRIRLWKWELQRLANETGLSISVCHFPPGTSKWNKVEHRLFSFITQNWRGKPLVSIAAIVSLIAATRTRTGLRVRCVLDSRRYPAAIKISDQQMAQVNLQPDKFHGEWNYTIHPVATVL